MSDNSNSMNRGTFDLADDKYLHSFFININLLITCHVDHKSMTHYFEVPSLKNYLLFWE